MITKRFLLLIILSIPSSLLAQSFTVAMRKEKNHQLEYRKVTLENLFETNRFEGQYFKIVLGKSQHAIAFNEESQLVLKAATVYYHLTQARQFWVKQFKHEKAINQKQLTIRLELTNLFDEFGHFAHDNRNPQFNNALSIPAGKTPRWVPEERQDSWGDEIWFRPKKKVLTSELGDIGKNPLEIAMGHMEAPIISYSMARLQNDLLMRAFYPSFSTGSGWDDLLRFAGTFAITKIISIGAQQADPLFLDKYYYLESPLIPEIIYHEYAHLMLSDYLEMSHSTPVNEGIADFFAARQAGKKRIYAPVKGLSNISAKKIRQKNAYSLLYEDLRQANADFTLSVLWDVTEILGHEIGDQIIYQSRKYLTTHESTISDGLIRAIMKSCDEVCPHPFKQKLMLYEGFRYRGF